MKFSVGVEYALHCLLYMVNIEEGRSVGIKDLATFQGISVPGVKGGYMLAHRAEEITFWDVVEAVEGKEHFFQCAEIRQNTILLDKENLPDSHTKCPCLIKVVMLDAENEMKKYLSGKTLAWLYDEVYNHKLPKDVERATVEWFNDARK